MMRALRSVGYVPRHKQPAVTATTDPCDLVDQWADDFLRLLEDAVPFGPSGVVVGRDLNDRVQTAGDLARIDLRDRMLATEMRS
jgi:hypothetical protein